MSNFVAIDFETANHSRTSACAVGMVHVKDGNIIAEETLLIRPPQRQFVFTYIHGLTWDDVKDEPTFVECWDDINGFISRGDFLVAHNAPFDRGVLQHCCENYDIPVPSLPSCVRFSLHANSGISTRQNFLMCVTTWISR